MGLILLRHLPGVEVLEYRVQQHGWTDALEEWAHELSEDLFGISEHDIEEDEEERFPVLRMMRDEADEYWARYGWDVTDGEGKLLAVMEYLTRPLVCVVEQRHPDAGYKGGVDNWAAALEQEAERFKPTRGPKSG